MRPKTRRIVRRIAYVLTAFLALGLFLHSPPAKSLVRRLVQRAVSSRTSGELTIGKLDYRLWRGELTASDVSWIGSVGSVRARELFVEISLFRPPLMRVTEPDIDLSFAESGGGPAGTLTLPALLFGVRVDLDSGTLNLRRPGGAPFLEVHELALELEPEGVEASGHVVFASALIRRGMQKVPMGRGEGRFRLRPDELVLDEGRLEKDDSFVSASGRVGPFSPLAAEFRFRHELDPSALDERLAIRGMVQGEGTISLRDSQWSGEGRLRSEELSYDSVGPFALEAPWTLARDVLRVEQGSFQGYGGSGNFDAALDFVSDRESFAVSLSNLDSRRWVRALGSRVSGRVEGSMERFDLATARVEGTLRLAAAAASAAGLPLSGSVRFQASSEAVRFEAPHLQARSFAVSASGSLGRALSLSASFSGTADDLADVGPLLRSVELPPPPVPLGGNLAFDGTVSGSLASPAVMATLATERFLIHDVPYSLQGEVSYRDLLVTLQDVVLRDEAGGKIRVDGRAPLSTKAGPISLEARAESLDLSPASSVAEIPLQGTLTASIAIGGPLTRPSFRGTFDSPGFTIKTANAVHGDFRGKMDLQGVFPELEGEASVTISNLSIGQAVLPEAEVALTSDGSQAHLRLSRADGRELVSARLALRAPYDLEADAILQNLPLTQIRPAFPDLVAAGAELEIEGRAHLETTLSRPHRLRYRVDTERFLGVYRSIVLGASTPFTIEGDEQSLLVRDLTLVGEDTAIGIDGVIPLSREGVVVLHAQGATRLELLAPWLPDFEPRGRANVDVTLEGALPDPWLRGELSLEEASVRLGEVRFEEVAATASWSDKALRLENVNGNVLGGRFRLEGELPPRLDSSAPVKLRFQADDLEPLRLAGALGAESALAEAELRLSIAGDLTGSGSNPLDWSGTGEMRQFQAKRRPLELASEGAARWMLENGRLELEGLHLLGGQTNLVVDAEAAPFAEPPSWSAHATGRIDHALSSVFLADLGWTFSGTTELDLRAGQGERPFFVEGRGSFEGARLVIRDPPIAFTGMSGELVLGGDTITLNRLSADAGGGKVDAEGQLTLQGASIAGVDFHARARSVRLSYPEGLRSEIDGEFQLAGDPDHLRLSGDVTLERALLSRDINVESEILQSLSGVGTAPAENPFASSVHLDIRVRAAEALRIDNNLARMDASVNLTVGGTLAAPELTGIAAARPGGSFRFGGNSYRLETGRIQLRGYPTQPPALDITARTSVAGYDIQLVLRGPTDDLTTELTSPSNPELSRADVASLLLTGRTLDKISSEGRAIVGEQMVSYVGATLADLAQLGLGEALPFDIVTVEPSLIAGEADPGARFTLGARFKNSLSLVYSIGLNNAEDQIWIVDYQLPRRARAQLVRDQNNKFTVGLGQELRLGVRQRAGAQPARQAVAAVDVTFHGGGGERPSTELELQRYLHIEQGDPYDYWQAWEQAEKLRHRLQELSYLEATIDLTTTPSGANGVALDYVVDLGPKVSFVFEGDEPDGSLKKGLIDLWNGRSAEAFVEADLVSFAEGRLYEKQYFTAQVQVSAKRSQDQLVVTVSIARGPRGKSVQVQITGNDAVPHSVLLQALPKPSSAAFHDLITTKRPRLKQLLTLQYASLGYVAASVSDPEVSFDPTTGILQVVIPVVEGARFRVAGVEIQGVSSIDENELRSRLQLRKGEVFRVTSLIKDRSAITSFYRDRGYPDVEVDADILKRPGAAELEARFVVREGSQVRVGKVEVEGNQATREGVIRREIAFEPGEPLSLSSVNETQKRLYDLGIFQSAEVVVGEKSEDSEHVVKVEVREAPELDLDYGLRASTEGFLEALGELRAPNLFGRAQHSGLRALVGKDRRTFRFTYHTPYFAKYRLDTDFWVERGFQHQGPEPIEGSPGEQTLPFTNRSWTFTAQQTRILSRQLSVQWSYTFDRQTREIEDPFFGPYTDLRNTASLTGAVIGDYRNSVVRPTRGSFWNATMQLAPKALGSDLGYERLYAQLFTFVPLGREVIWASAYRLGVAASHGNELDIDQGFRAGGPSSVRGFDAGSLGPVGLGDVPYGGNGLVVLNQEIRFPILWHFRGVGFYDAGNAFATVSDIRFSDLRQSAGAGLRFELPFGLLRLDLAHAFGLGPEQNPWRLIFSLGHAF